MRLFECVSTHQKLAWSRATPALQREDPPAETTTRHIRTCRDCGSAWQPTRACAERCWVYRMRACNTHANEFARHIWPSKRRPARGNDCAPQRRMSELRLVAVASARARVKHLVYRMRKRFTRPNVRSRHPMSVQCWTHQRQRLRTTSESVRTVARRGNQRARVSSEYARTQACVVHSRALKTKLTRRTRARCYHGEPQF